MGGARIPAPRMDQSRFYLDCGIGGDWPFPHSVRMATERVKWHERASRGTHCGGDRRRVGHRPRDRAGLRTRRSVAPVSPDIVGPAIFLASDLSAYVTGSVVMVDGG